MTSYTPFPLLVSLCRFLELSWLRAGLLFLIWLTLGFFIVKLGGYNAVEAMFINLFELVFFTIMNLIIGVITLIGTAFMLWLFFKPGGGNGYGWRTNPQESYKPGNIYHDD